jgi:hypothetical protein
MIHLFNQVYLSYDNIIDENIDRVVISEEFGKHMLQYAARPSHGALLYAGMDINDLATNGISDFFNNLATHKNKVVIYASRDSFLEILVLWFTSLLKHADKDTVQTLCKALIFRIVVFSNGRFITRSDKNKTEYSPQYYEFPQADFDSYYKLALESNLDLAPFLNNIGVEYMLATYLYSGHYKEELKSLLKPLIRKDMIKYLYELKEIFLVHLMTPAFTNKMSLTKDYDFNTFTDIINDDSRFAKTFMSTQIWETPFMSAYGNHDIFLENITPEDIQVFKDFTHIAGNTWIEESVYIFVKSDINKLDFLACFLDFTDDLLDKIIEAESTFEHSAGSFFSIDVTTVNHYLVQGLLKNRNNKEYLRLYSI